MVLTHVKMFISRNDVKILIVSTATGGVLQFFAKKYLKNHPELLKDLKDARPKELIPHVPRGGDLTIVTAALKLTPILLNFFADHGLTAGILSGLGIMIGKIPITALSTTIRKCSVQNMSHLDKNRFVLRNGEITYIDQCDENMKYILTILKDETMPFEKKREVVEKVFSKYLNLDTDNGRRNFVLCIVFISYMVSTSNFYMLIAGLIKSIKEGKISKEIGRLIVRKLIKSGISVDPELVDLVKY